MTRTTTTTTSMILNLIHCSGERASKQTNRSTKVHLFELSSNWVSLSLWARLSSIVHFACCAFSVSVHREFLSSSLRAFAWASRSSKRNARVQVKKHFCIVLSWRTERQKFACCLQVLFFFFWLDYIFLRSIARIVTSCCLYFCFRFRFRFFFFWWGCKCEFACCRRCRLFHRLHWMMMMMMVMMSWLANVKSRNKFACLRCVRSIWCFSLPCNLQLAACGQTTTTAATRKTTNNLKLMQIIGRRCFWLQTKTSWKR